MDTLNQYIKILFKKADIKMMGTLQFYTMNSKIQQNVNFILSLIKHIVVNRMKYFEENHPIQNKGNATHRTTNSRNDKVMPQ